MLPPSSSRLVGLVAAVLAGTAHGGILRWHKYWGASRASSDSIGPYSSDVLRPANPSLAAVSASTSAPAPVSSGSSQPSNSSVTDSPSQAAPRYQLEMHYNASNFFDEFDFFTTPDPTHGTVEYVNKTTAFHNQLAGFTGTLVYMGVDSWTQQPVKGRRSVRLTSQKAYTHGLFIADIRHMPDSVCGSWPAFWMFGPSWPRDGEIDIIEGVNLQRQNQLTLHTSDGCSITNTGSLNSTQLLSPVCDASKNGNAGCSQLAAEPSTYGSNFNLAAGGVYAVDWTSDHISIYFFMRRHIPHDIVAGKPNPRRWGTPLARFNGGAGCSLDDHFRELSFVFDTTFCGDWAGQVWGSDPTCSKLAPTCADWVLENPTEFETQYWLLDYISVYQQ